MMGTLGLTFGQIGIGTNIYSDVRKFSPPAIEKNIIQHAVAASTSFPTKDAGYVPSNISGTLLITAASVPTFISDVQTGTAERKVSWMLGATEVYCYAYSGSVSSPVCMNPYGTATRLYEVSFKFPLSRSTIYLASDDSVYLGG